MTKNKKECFILGARPTVIKLAPLIKKMDAFVIHTGQHRELADEMYKIFDIVPDIDLKLMTENQTLPEFTSKCMTALDGVFKENEFSRIWVHGDTASCLAGALVAYMNRIPLVHNEAGLRSYDRNNPFPEEMFRTVIDSLSDIMFAPTSRAVDNLKKENVKGKIYLVGNTIIDALTMIRSSLPKERPIKEKYILATVHRRESFGTDILNIFEALKEISKTTKVILPAHPNPNVQEAIKKIGLEVVKPMNYVDFLWYLRDCEYVITDSGGVQEEAPSFGKKIVVLRKTTERQEIIESGYGILVEKMEKDYIVNRIKEFATKEVNVDRNPFGDGKTSEKIVEIINSLKNEKI
ncbi:MAG: UDP-N-acetylglucosamine 2-epimerase (non-hydrolyzing) [Methanogenium sp.]|jgi:UDP-N-acetylglucosamine 2-epimerase (non-hydrolysing)